MPCHFYVVSDLEILEEPRRTGMRRRIRSYTSLEVPPLYESLLDTRVVLQIKGKSKMMVVGEQNLSVAKQVTAFFPSMRLRMP